MFLKFESREEMFIEKEVAEVIRDLIQMKKLEFLHVLIDRHLLHDKSIAASDITFIISPQLIKS